LHVQHEAMDDKKTIEIANMMANECVAMRLRFVNRIISGLYERNLASLGVTISQAGILVLLSIRGQSNHSEIGRIFQMEKSTVSRNIGRMKKRGWLQITATDGQALQTITLTPKGRELLGEVYPKWKKAQEAAGELLGEEAVTSLRALYDTLRQG
jgi:DNA-binding MarR family transcriptional regulator